MHMYTCGWIVRIAFETSKVVHPTGCVQVVKKSFEKKVEQSVQ